MTEFKRLDDTVFAAGQISAADLDAALEQGVRCIVCNRPDDEDTGQPTAEAVRGWAEDRGLAFRHIPVSGGEITPEAVGEMAAALREAAGTTLAYCRSGGRSAALWALASAAEGRHTPERALALADNAGYELGALAPALDQLAREGLPPTDSD